MQKLSPHSASQHFDRISLEKNGYFDHNATARDCYEAYCHEEIAMHFLSEVRFRIQ
jgi:hypothetical protein